ncbi:MAG: GntR family transcriptional regulator [Gemmatimonadaceae bacterium]
MPETLEIITQTLRGRVLRGLQSATLAIGDRLPSARSLAKEFSVDFRLILSAYRALAREGLVDLRPRGGVYVAKQRAKGVLPLPESWLADILTQALAREIPAPDFHEWLRRCTETLRLRAVVIASTEDQVHGLCRELTDDFGLDAEGFTADRVRGESPPPLAIRRADLLVTTGAHDSWVRELGRQLKKDVTVVDVRPDLLGGEWSLLLRRPVYAVVGTEDFARMLREFFASSPGAENLHILVLGRDDLTTIPAGAPTYVTQRVRASLGSLEIRGRILPPARTIRSESVREIFSFIVRSNLEAIAGRPH